MSRRLTIIQGHPDPAGNRLCHALADAYIGGAAVAGHAVAHIDAARLDFPILRTRQIFEHSDVPETWLRPGMRLCRHSTCS
jgi:putative NADPH-quinone reductase